MRNPVATPASVILLTLLLGFAAIVVFCYATTSKTMYVLEPGRWAYIWERAFVLFTDSFFAFQCAGALIAYSLFLGAPVFFERKALFRSLTSVIVSLVVLAGVYVACREAFLPVVKRQMRQTRSIGLFSDALYQASLARAKAGDPVTALEYLRISLLSDGRNPDKLAQKAALLSRLTNAQYEEYLARTTGSDPREAFDAAAVLARARSALEKKDFVRAYDYAEAVLAVEQSNAEALRIAGIAGEKSYRETAARAAENERYLYNRKKEGAALLQSGKAGADASANSVTDLLRAYYLFADLHRRFPLDPNVSSYLQEAGDLLPAVSFFTADAELALSFEDLADKNVVFWNPVEGGGRELVSIDSLVSAGEQTYFRDVEVAGFGPPDGGNRLLYHYVAPLGKRSGGYINLNGIDKADPGRRTEARLLAGRPAWDPDQGIRLNVDPDSLRSFSLSQAELEDRSLGELFSLVPPFRRPGLFAGHARMDDLIVREIVLHAVQPLFLVILTLLCFSIGLTQNARYLSSVPKSIYVWVLAIPFVMLAVMEIVLFLYRMGAVFLYYALGQVPGIIAIAALHVFFLVLALLRYGGRIGASLRR